LVRIEWLITGAAIAIAVAAYVKARRLAKRLERLTESYWELRYDHGQLRARVNRLDPGAAPSAAEPPKPAAGSTAFVPLSSLKR